MILKPYQLVLVNMDDYQFVGETMSFPVPGGSGATIMVRKAPGEPATLVELPVTRLVKVLDSRPRRYIHWAEAKCMDGIPTAFPVDMLRREVASPVNFNPETGVIDTTMGWDAPMYVAKVTVLRSALWNMDRWKSFGWVLEPRTSERFTPNVN